jgi:hypothetical protein
MQMDEKLLSGDRMLPTSVLPQVRKDIEESL